MRSGTATLRKLAAPVPELVADNSSLSSDFSQLFIRARRQFLEALPLPGALVGQLGGATKLVDCNAEFRRLEESNGAPLLGDGEVGTVVETFLAGDDEIADYAWSDGDPITGREYTLRLARMRLVLSEAPACLLTFLDRTAERSAQKSLRMEMFSDSLTGLPNRAGFSDILEGQLAEAAPGTRAVLVIDLSRFSRVNESIGPLSGDELLITVARRMLSATRAGDVLARTGGNEFGVCLTLAHGVDEAVAVARRLMEVLSTPCRLSELEIQVDCAVGCAVFEAGCDGDELIRRAQFAVKRAKASRQVEVYQPQAFDLACHSFSIETALRRAIESERLTLAFQPIVDLRTGAVAAFEALARWTEDGSEISPSTFVPVAEESGLIVPLGRWALEAAIRTLDEWDRRSGRTDIRMNVNLSSIQIARDDVPGLVNTTLSAHAIDPARLVLEITESAIVADPDRAARTLHSIRATGATLALDDFGTGYSNLSYLQRLPIDMLKIDQSFVTGMLGDRDKVAIVRAILSLAEALGLETTAEGVETHTLSQTLSALGCTRAQGYVYAPPLDPKEAFAYWARSSAATASAS